MTPDTALRWKLRAFAVGALFMVLGIVLDRRPLLLVSVAALAAGIVLRLATRRGPPPRHPSWDEPDPGAEGEPPR